MSDEDIELPPLPKASKMYDIPGYDEEELKDYARAAVCEALERVAALLHEEATGEPWTVAGVEHPGPDRDYYRGLARKVAALAAMAAQGEDDAWCAECGVKLENVRPGKHQHPICSQAAPAAPQPAQSLTDEHKVILRECRNQAMKWSLDAQIPEAGAFGGIAQDLDYLCAQLGVKND